MLQPFECVSENALETAGASFNIVTPPLNSEAEPKAFSQSLGKTPQIGFKECVVIFVEHT